MAERRDILWRFLGDAKSLNRATKSGEKSLGKMQQGMSGLGKAAGALGIGLGAGALVQGIGSAINRAEAMESQYAITEQVLETTGNAAGLTAEEIKEAAKQMALTTGIPKEVAMEAQNVLLTFTNLKGVAGEASGEFERATALTADMATVFGGSAKDAAKQLGKALNDPVGGISALSRVGVQFTEDQKGVIKSLVETGDVAAAQRVILEELEKQVGGTAEASADSSEIMARSWDEVTEALGKELLPVLDDLAAMMLDIQPLLEGLARNASGVTSEIGELANSIEDLIGGGEGGLIGAANSLGRLAWENTKFIPGLNLLDRGLRENNINLGVMADESDSASSGIASLSTEAAYASGAISGYASDAKAAAGANNELAGSAWNAEAAMAALIDRVGYWEAGKAQREVDAQKDEADAEREAVGRRYGHAGGVVPGAAGKNVPMVLQGGEQVIPRGGGGSSETVININIGVAGDPYQTAQTIADLLTRYEQSNGSRFNGVSP